MIFVFEGTRPPTRHFRPLTPRHFRPRGLTNGARKTKYTFPTTAWTRWTPVASIATASFASRRSQPNATKGKATRRKAGGVKIPCLRLKAASSRVQGTYKAWPSRLENVQDARSPCGAASGTISNYFDKLLTIQILPNLQLFRVWSFERRVLWLKVRLAAQQCVHFLQRRGWVAVLFQIISTWDLEDLKFWIQIIYDSFTNLIR